jgi:phosphoribosylformylglycinamidine synthase
MSGLVPDPPFPVPAPATEPVPDESQDPTVTVDGLLQAFGSSEFAKALLGSLWGTPPSLDLDAEADLHSLLQALADRKLVRSACDVSDGGIAVALAQAGFPKHIGASVEQDPSLLAHPLFGLFAEPASTVLVSTAPENVSAIEKLAGKFSFLAARIGATGGNPLQINVDGESFISAPLEDLRRIWASALEANLREEVLA